MKVKTVRVSILLMAFGFLAVNQSMAQDQENRRERREPPSIDELFKHMDKNEDGKLSKDEVKGPLKDHFSKVDTNEDGYLTREELENAPKPRRRQQRN